MFPNAPLGSFTAATRRSGSGQEQGLGLVFTTANELNRFSPARGGRSRRSLLAAGRSNDYCKQGKGRGREWPRRPPVPTGQAGSGPARRPSLVSRGASASAGATGPGLAPGAGPGSLRHCTWRGERGAPSWESPQGFSSRAQTCWGQPVRPFSFFSPWPKGCE